MRFGFVLRPCKTKAHREAAAEWFAGKSAFATMDTVSPPDRRTQISADQPEKCNFRRFFEKLGGISALMAVFGSRKAAK
jgi:hypothetical protein